MQLISGGSGVQHADHERPHLARFCSYSQLVLCDRFGGPGRCPQCMRDANLPPCFRTCLLASCHPAGSRMQSVFCFWAEQYSCSLAGNRFLLQVSRFSGWPDFEGHHVATLQGRRSGWVSKEQLQFHERALPQHVSAVPPQQRTQS